MVLWTLRSRSRVPYRRGLSGPKAASGAREGSSPGQQLASLPVIQPAPAPLDLHHHHHHHSTSSYSTPPSHRPEPPATAFSSRRPLPCEHFIDLLRRRPSPHAHSSPVTCLTHRPVTRSTSLPPQRLSRPPTFGRSRAASPSHDHHRVRLAQHPPSSSLAAAHLDIIDAKTNTPPATASIEHTQQHSMTPTAGSDHGLDD